MSYTSFKNIAGGQNGTVLGALPVEGVWEAFAYRKALTVQVFLDTDLDALGTEVRDLKGTWQVRIRENAARGANGASKIG